MGNDASCAVCGAPMVVRSPPETAAHLAFVRELMVELSSWDADVLSPGNRAVLLGRYRQQERVLALVLGERVDPAPVSARVPHQPAPCPQPTAVKTAAPLEVNVPPAVAAEDAFRMGAGATRQPAPAPRAVVKAAPANSAPTPHAAGKPAAAVSAPTLSPVEKPAAAKPALSLRVAENPAAVTLAPTPSPTFHAATEPKTAAPPAQSATRAASPSTESGLPRRRRASPTEDEKRAAVEDEVVEAASVWHRTLKPFLHESVGWFVGGFLILVGTLYWVSDAWSTMSGTARSVTVFGFAAAWAMGFAAWSRFLSRREVTRGAAEVLSLIAASVVPLAPVALSPISATAVWVFAPLMLGWGAFAFVFTLGVARRRCGTAALWVALGSASATAVMGVAGWVASPLVAAVPLALLYLATRRPGASVLAWAAPMYFLVLVCARLQVASPLALGSWAPVAGATLFLLHRVRGVRRADVWAVGTVVAQALLLWLSAFGEHPAFFLTSVALLLTSLSLVSASARFAYPAYLGAYLAFQTCGTLVPEQLKALVGQLREALGYSASQPLPAAYDAIYAMVFVVGVGVYAALRLGGRVQRAALNATACGAVLVTGLGLAALTTDARPALWSAPAVALLCLVLGATMHRRTLSWVGAACALASAVAVLAASGPVWAVGAIAAVLALLSLPQLDGHRQAHSAGAAAVALLTVVGAFSSGGPWSGAVALVLAAAAAVLVARNLNSAELLAAAFFLPALVLPRLCMGVWSAAVGPAMACSALLLAVAGRRVASARTAAWLYAVLAPLVHFQVGSPWLGVTLLLSAAGLALGHRNRWTDALAIVCCASALGPIDAERPLLPLAFWVGPVGALGAAAAASWWKATRGRSLQTTLAGVGALWVALAGSGAAENAGQGTLGALLVTAVALAAMWALLPAVTVPLAAAFAAAACGDEHPVLLMGVLVATSCLGLLRGRLKGVASAASLTALLMSPVVLALTVWHERGLLVVVAAALACCALLWTRTTRWPVFGALVPLFLLVPQFASASAAQLGLAVGATVALTRSVQLSERFRRLVGLDAWRVEWFGGAVCVGLALAGVALRLTGFTHGLPIALGLLLAAGPRLSWRIAVAAALALSIPGLASLSAVALLALALFVRHAPKAARWLLADEHRGWAVSAAALSSVASAAFAAMSQPASFHSALLLGGCLAACAVLQGWRWLLGPAVLVAALPLAALFVPLGVWLPVHGGVPVFDVLLSARWSSGAPAPAAAAVLVAASVAALLRHASVSAAVLRGCAHIGRAFDGPLGTPVWLGAAATLALSWLSGAVDLKLAAVAASLLLLVTPVAWEAAAAIGLLAIALARVLPPEATSTVLSLVGAGLCIAGRRLELKWPVGRVWHHAGWLLGLASLPWVPGLHSIGTVLTCAALSASVWSAARRRPKTETLAWAAGLGALHVAAFWAGLRLSHGDPQALILPWCALLSVAVAAAALSLPHSLQRYRVAFGLALFGVAELAAALLLLRGAYPREALVAAVASAVLVFAFGRRLAEDDDGAAGWLVQLAAVSGGLSLMVLGAGRVPDAVTAWAALVFGAVLLAVSRLLGGAGRQSFRRGAWGWPLAGLLAAPFHQTGWLAALLVAQAVHFATLASGRFGRRRFAVLSGMALNGAVVCLWMAGSIGHFEYLLVPLGLTALVLLQLYQADFSAESLGRLRAGAVCLVYAAVAFEPLAFSRAWTLWLCALVCVLGVAAGIALKVRSFVFLGSGFLVTTVVASLTRYGIQQPRVGALLLSGLGLLIVGFMVLVSTRRSELLARYQRARDMLALWQG